MKKLMIIVLFAFCATLASKPAIASEKENLNGTWLYKVAAAPYEYNSGKLIFGEKDGKITGTIKFMDGSEIKAQEVSIDNNNFSFSVVIQDNQVKVTGKIVTGKITGKVYSPQGLMDLTAERAKTPTN
jgi:hypothetical protein